MNDVHLYSLSKNLEIENRGLVGLQTAKEAIDKYAHAHANIQGSVEYVASHSIFGFSVGENAFLEIHIESETHFRVKFKMNEEIKLWFLKLPGFFEKTLTINGTNALKELVTKFYELPPPQFKDHFLTICAT
ncbi:hypothetical protein ACFLQY_01525 [Verrucomicrobiota bacterium]